MAELKPPWPRASTSAVRTGAGRGCADDQVEVVLGGRRRRCAVGGIRPVADGQQRGGRRPAAPAPEQQPAGHRLGRGDRHPARAEDRADRLGLGAVELGDRPPRRRTPRRCRRGDAGVGQGQLDRPAQAGRAAAAGPRVEGRAVAGDLAVDRGAALAGGRSASSRTASRRPRRARARGAASKGRYARSGRRWCSAGRWRSWADPAPRADRARRRRR